MSVCVMCTGPFENKKLPVDFWVIDGYVKRRRMKKHNKGGRFLSPLDENDVS